METYPCGGLRVASLPGGGGGPWLGNMARRILLYERERDVYYYTRERDVYYYKRERDVYYYMTERDVYYYMRERDVYYYMGERDIPGRGTPNRVAVGGRRRAVAWPVPCCSSLAPASLGCCPWWSGRTLLHTTELWLNTFYLRILVYVVIYDSG